MKKISLFVHQRYVEDIIKHLHEIGLMEIVDITKQGDDTPEGLEPSPQHPETTVCFSYEQRLTRLIQILQHVQRKPSGIKALLNPELPEVKTVQDRTLEELYSYVEGILADCESSILAKDEQRKQIQDQQQTLQSEIEQLRYLTDFDLDLADVGDSTFLFVKIGKTEDLESLKASVHDIQHVAIFSQKYEKEKTVEWAVVAVGYIKEKEIFDKQCREYLTEFSLQDRSGKPWDLLMSLEQQHRDLQQQQTSLLQELRDVSESQLNDLLSLREEVQLERVRRGISKHFAKTQSTYLIKGWTLEKNEDRLHDLVDKVSEGCAVMESQIPSLNPDYPPTYVETPHWARGFKSLLSMFASPKYNEVNPTVIMGLFFVFFFGLMLGDAGYGIVILALSLVAYTKFAQISPALRSFAFMGILMGVITTIVGILTNGFFGDFIPRFIYGNENLPLYSLQVFGIHLPANHLKDPLPILSLALIFGLLHLNVGVVLGLYQAWKRRHYKEMLTGHFCWVPLQLGGIMLIGYFILDWSLSTPLFYAAAVLVVIGLILLFAASGPLGFFNITGYIGDWLSYARLLALGLATAGMALAFNIVSQLMRELIPIEIIGIIVMVILLIILHTVNLGLQSLGAAVHSLRLQYVEFFNRFYEGGGREYKPFHMHRKYTKLEGETNN
jgi:V/A-type H+-transporting ATPase subunit I